MEAQELRARSFVTDDESADGEGPVEMTFIIRVNSDGHLQRIIATDPQGSPWVVSLKLSGPDGEQCCCPDENGRILCVPKGKLGCSCDPK